MLLSPEEQAESDKRTYHLAREIAAMANQLAGLQQRVHIFGVTGDLESMADALDQVVVLNDELRGMYRQFLAARIRQPRLPSGDGAVPPVPMHGQLMST
jgi:hypothetical protein